MLATDTQAEAVSEQLAAKAPEPQRAEARKSTLVLILMHLARLAAALDRMVKAAQKARGEEGEDDAARSRRDSAVVTGRELAMDLRMTLPPTAAGALM